MIILASRVKKLELLLQFLKNLFVTSVRVAAEQVVILRAKTVVWRGVPLVDDKRGRFAGAID